MESINSFEKGLHINNFPTAQPEGTYRDALNWVRNDDGQLVNERKEKVIFSGISKSLLNFIILNNDVICLFSDEIGVLDSTDNYTTLYTDVNLNIQSTVDIEARVGFNNHRLVYFVDGQNPDRFLDLDNPDIGSLTLKDTELNLGFSIPIITGGAVSDTGNLPTGVYYLVARYATASNNKTAFGIPSNPITIVDDLLSSTRDNYDGADPQTNSTKAITFSVTNRDENYPFIEIVAITYIGTTNQLVAYSLGLRPNTSSPIVFSNITQEQDTVDIAEILANPLFYNTSKHIVQKDNILVRSNLTTGTKNIALQEYVNTISTQVYLGSLDVTNTVTVTAPTTQSASDILIKDAYQSAILEGFKNPTTIQIGKSFQRGEIYSLAFTPIYKDGSLGFAYHIPAQEDVPLPFTQPFYSTIDYPSGQGYPTGKIRHHQIPDEIEDSGAYKIVTATTIVPLYLQLNLPVIPDVIKDEIQGYIIGYQKRDSSLNRKIVTKGILRPYNTNVSGTSYGVENENFKVSPITGMTIFKQQEASIFFPASATAYNFLSPDVFHGYSVYGNKVRITHKSSAESYLTYKTGNINMGVFLNEDISARSIFTSLDGSLLRERTLTKIQEIPQIPKDTLYTLTSNSRTFEYSGIKGLVHLETDATLTDIQDVTYDQSGGAPTTNAKTYFYFTNETDNFYHPKRLVTGTSTTPDKAPIFYSEIINNNPNQYGNLEDAEYSTLYVNTNLAQLQLIVQGDTYIQKYGMTIAEQVQDASDGPSFSRFDTTINFWMESTNNFNLRHNSDNAIPYYGKYKILYNASGSSPLGLHNLDLDQPYASGYNKQYSLVNDLRRSFPKPTIFEEVNSFPNRSIYSEKVFEGELVDQMRVYLPNNFHDIPKNKGEITDTFVYNNTFYHHTEHSLFQSFFNERAMVPTTDETIYLGTSGVFQQASKEIFPLTGGYCGTTSKAGLNTPFGRIFLDNHQGKVFMLSEGIDEISDLGMFNFFRDFVNTTDIYTSGYDYTNRRYIVSSSKDTISYYPKAKCWVSRHTFKPSHYININRRTLAFFNQEFYDLQGTDHQNANITLALNPTPDEYKRFDNLEINNTSNKNNTIIPLDNYSFDKETFSTIQAWNTYQNTGVKNLTLATDFNSANDYTKHIIKFNRGAYNTELPLDVVVDPYKNIFDLTNLDDNLSFKQRLVDKFLILKLEYNNINQIVFNYIKTAFVKTIR